MRFRLSASANVALAVFACAILAQLLAMAGSPAKLKFTAYLIWATNDKVSPDPKHKAVDPAIRKKLENMPFKWANYFEVNRKSFEVPFGGKTQQPMSEHCSIEVTSVKEANIEVGFIGQGKPVERRMLELPKGQVLVYGGNAPNATAWFLALKRTE